MQKPNYSDSDCGPYTADQLQPKTPYELSNGNFIQCMPTGGRGAKTSGSGFEVLETDPKVKSAGIDTGYAINHNTVRAPDIAIGDIPNKPGWVPGVPLLAVEYADTGQDEKELAVKIQQFLSGGTKYIWVVRLVGPRRVEIYEPGKPMRKALPGEFLTAPEALQNPVEVNALYDQEAAHEATLRNLLQRKGYASLEAVEVESKAEGEAVILKKLIVNRFGTLPDWAKQRIDTANAEQVETWAEGIFDAKNVEALLA